MTATEFEHEQFPTAPLHWRRLPGDSNADRSIVVKQGDSLSKYSMAIYGNFKHIDKFWRKRNGSLKRVMDENKDLIITGESLYHPDPLPKEPPGEGTGGSEPEKPPLQEQYVGKFFQWIAENFTSTSWTVDANSGAHFSVSFIQSGWGKIGIDFLPWLPLPTRWYQASGSETFYDIDKLVAYEPDAVRSGRGSGRHYEQAMFGSPGCVLLPRGSNTTLTYSAFVGKIVVIGVGAGVAAFQDGRHVTAIIFGMKCSPSAMLAALDLQFRWNNSAFLQTMMSATGACVALVPGPKNNLPQFGMVVRWGSLT